MKYLGMYVYTHFVFHAKPVSLCLCGFFLHSLLKKVLYIHTLPDIFLPGSYTRQIDPTTYHPLHYPYNMAIAKGSSFEAEGGAIKKPRTVFAPKQLLHLEEEFVKNQFPNMEQRKQIAKDLDLTQQHIQVCLERSVGMLL